MNQFVELQKKLKTWTEDQDEDLTELFNLHKYDDGEYLNCKNLVDKFIMPRLKNSFIHNLNFRRDEAHYGSSW